MGKRNYRALRARALYGGLVFVSAIGRRLPLGVARAVGRVLGRMAWHVARRERRRALENLAIAFPDHDAATKRRIIKSMFQHLGMSLMEIIWLPNINEAARSRTTVIEGLDRVLEIIDSGRGVVVVTAHCGNWEWTSYITGTFGRPLAVLQRERDDPQMNRFITEMRARAGVRTIDRGSPGAAREMIQAVRRGGMLAFVLDQNIRTESVKIPFFGRPAPTPIGPIKFAIRTEAVVALALIERGEDGIQYVRWGEPIYCKRDDDPIALATRITASIEEQIRRRPEQWVWMHDRWRERPEWDVTASPPAAP